MYKLMLTVTQSKRLGNGSEFYNQLHFFLTSYRQLCSFPIFSPKKSAFPPPAKFLREFVGKVHAQKKVSLPSAQSMTCDHHAVSGVIPMTPMMAAAVIGGVGCFL